VDKGDELGRLRGQDISCKIKKGANIMAIKTENIEINGRELIKHESDAGKIILQVETGREYASAVDVIPCRYTYEETDKDISDLREVGGYRREA
jgi:hypothetical protein